MNMPAPSLRPAHGAKTKFHPRMELLDEVVAGLLWMQLDLPDDTTRDEMEKLAHRLVLRIQGGANEARSRWKLRACRTASWAAPPTCR